MGRKDATKIKTDRERIGELETWRDTVTWKWKALVLAAVVIGGGLVWFQLQLNSLQADLNAKRKAVAELGDQVRAADKVMKHTAMKYEDLIAAVREAQTASEDAKDASGKAVEASREALAAANGATEASRGATESSKQALNAASTATAASNKAAEASSEALEAAKTARAVATQADTRLRECEAIVAAHQTRLQTEDTNRDGEPNVFEVVLAGMNFKIEFEEGATPYKSRRITQPNYEGIVVVPAKAAVRVKGTVTNGVFTVPPSMKGRVAWDLKGLNHRVRYR